jgi:hypothetical protein
MWKNIVVRGRPLIKIHMRIPCWVPKSTNTFSEYVTLIAFPLQQWLHERTSVLRSKYIASLLVSREGPNPCTYVISIVRYLATT